MRCKNHISCLDSLPGDLGLSSEWQAGLAYLSKVRTAQLFEKWFTDSMSKFEVPRAEVNFNEADRMHETYGKPEVNKGAEELLAVIRDLVKELQVNLKAYLSLAGVEGWASRVSRDEKQLASRPRRRKKNASG